MDSSTQPTSSTVPAATSASGSWNPFQHSLNSTLTVKLDRSNFLAWKSQVLPTVIGHGLDDLLLTGVPPPATLVNGLVNPAFVTWRRQDQLLLSWLRSAMTEAVLGSLAHHESSHAISLALQ